MEITGYAKNNQLFSFREFKTHYYRLVYEENESKECYEMLQIHCLSNFAEKVIWDFIFLNSLRTFPLEADHLLLILNGREGGRGLQPFAPLLSLHFQEV